MAEQPQPNSDPKESLHLKLDEPEILSAQPWKDDVLGRDQIAKRLTNLIPTQSSPFAISIHGNWGTGKTFLLKRWQAQLERDGCRAIYFNAWEDDFSDDPLLAMLGQLSEHFKEEGIRAIANEVFQTAVPLFRQNALGMLKKHAGITLELEERYQEEDFLEAYLQQRSTRDELRHQLCRLSTKIREDTGHPTVFIVDELDRCRPTFAIEVLERVKHIFDVPNLVFIFGINRDELCKSLRSIYGEIDADIYLRRFFDMEFILPDPADSGAFTRHLMGKYGLLEFAHDLSTAPNGREASNEFQFLANEFPVLWRHLGLSLRDIDYCIRSIAFVASNLELGRSVYPCLLGTLITLKLQEPVLYSRFVQGACRASDVINHLDNKLSPYSLDRRTADVLDMMEADLYGSESDGNFDSPTSSLGQLKLLADGKPLTNAEVLSNRMQARAGATRLLQYLQSSRWWHAGTATYIASLIDMHHGLARR